MKGMVLYRRRYVFLFIIILLSPLIFSNNNQTLIADNELQEFQLGNISEQLVLDITDNSLVEELFDDLIPTQLEERNIVGATASFVKGGELIFSKGYGLSNKLISKPVNGNETLFRIGSVSKTFTAVAVLQLVEDGLLDLDVDVNNYLTDFEIPETYSNPITIRHLLTHTAGFEETPYPVIYSSILEVDDIEDILATGMPDRVHPPGEIVAYSNYGLTLAGYLVEIMTRKHFADYVDEEICIPLGMNSTTFMQPLPLDLHVEMSEGYDSNEDAGFFEFISVYPAGSCSSTAIDMSKFMLMLLNNGIYNGTRILENSTIEIMLGANFVSHEKMQGVGLGVYDMDANGYNVVGHGGDTIFFHSKMFLMPDYDLGVFVSYNSRNGVYATAELFYKFMETFFPFDDIEITPLKNYKRRVNRFEGFYVTTRRTYSDKPQIEEKEWLSDGFYLKAKHGHLVIEGVSGIDFVEVEPLFFRESSGNFSYSIAFFEDEKGRITHLISDLFGGILAFEKTHILYFRSELHTSTIIVIAVLMLFSLAFWGVKGINRVVKKKEKDPKMNRIARWLAFANFSLLGIIVIIMQMKINNDIILEIETNKVFGGLLVFPYLFIISTIGLMVFAGYAWSGFKDVKRRPYWTTPHRIHYSMFALLSLAIVGLLAYWKMLGF